MEYYENGVDAVASLSWSSASQAKETIPQASLFPATTPPQPPTPNRDAYTTIEAESYDQTSGVTRTASDVGSLDNNDWLKFAAVDFGSTGARSVQFNLAVPASNSGGTIEIRADGTSGTLLGTLKIQTTGSYATFFTQRVNIAFISGVHDVYLVFKNGTSLGNLDSFKFSTVALTKIMALGDSITQGDSGHNDYRYYLWQQLQAAGYNFDFVGSMTKAFDGNSEPPNYGYDQDNEGHAGYTTAQVLAGVNGWASATMPDIVLLHIGTNDVLNGVANNTIINNISQIINALRAVNANITILLAQIIPSSGYTSQISQLNSSIASLVGSKNTAQSRVILVDQYTGINVSTDLWDGIHTNNTGSQKMSSQWFTALQGVLS